MRKVMSYGMVGAAAWLVAGGFMAQATLVTNVVMQDNFNRTGDLHGSTTSDGKFTWSEAGGSLAAVVDNQLDFKRLGGRALIDDPSMAEKDFLLKFDYIYGQAYADNFWLSVNYRLATAYTDIVSGGHQDGYILSLGRNSATNLTVALMKEAGADDVRTTIASVNVLTANYNSPNAISLRVVGDSHQVHVNDVMVLDVTDSEWSTAGYWNFRDGGSRDRSVDNLEYSSVVPEPASLSLIALSGSFIFILRRRLRS